MARAIATNAAQFAVIAVAFEFGSKAMADYLPSS